MHCGKTLYQRGIALCRRRRYLGAQLLLLVALNIFAGCTTYVFTGFTAEHRLYWDRLSLSGFFRDNLHALNYFGEIEWWNPNAGVGFPIYYASILGTTHGANPLFVTFGFVFWLLGRLSLIITDYYWPYVAYIGFLVPLIFNLGLLCLARQIFKNPLVVAFVIVAGSFSPGVVFNVSDDGLELVGYALFLAAAYVHFQQHPGRRSFWLLTVSSLLVAISFNHLSLYWNLIFLPLWMVVCSLWGAPGDSRLSFRQLGNLVPRHQQLLAALAISVCLLPLLITFMQGDTILRTTIGTRTYYFADLRPGNPLEFLSVATPGVGFEWGDEGWRIYPTDRHVSYTYLGLLTMPLACLGLTLGRRPWRLRLFILLLVAAAVMLLAPHSPLFASLLIWDTPLRSVNHYSDTVVRLGIFYLLILAGALGMEVVLHSHAGRRWLVALFGMWTLLSAGLFVAVYREQSLLAPWAGFALTMCFFYGIVLVWLIRSRNGRQKRLAIAALLCLLVIDTSTVALIFIKNVSADGIWLETYETPESDAIGTTGHAGYYVEELLTLSDVFDLNVRHLDPGVLPPLAVYAATPAADILGEWQLGSDPTQRCWATAVSTEEGAEVRYELTNEVGEKITVSREEDRLLLSADEIVALVAPDGNTIYWSNGTTWQRPGSDRTAAAITVIRQTYNRLTVEVTTPQAGQLFWRDPYFPGWQATVNGQPVAITKTLTAFKSVPVPAGKGVVEFYFTPPGVPGALLAAYVTIGISVAMWLRSPRDRRQL